MPMPPGKIVGVIGVLGPTRLNYGRIIPMVDHTAKVIGRLLGLAFKEPPHERRNRTGNARSAGSPTSPDAAEFAVLEALKAEIETLQGPAPARPGRSGEYPPPRRARKDGSLAICGDQIRPRHAGHRRQFRPRPGRLPAGSCARPPIRRSRPCWTAWKPPTGNCWRRWNAMASSPIDTDDGKFDPNLHQAIAEVPGNGKPPGSIVDVVQTGYHDRRPAAAPRHGDGGAARRSRRPADVDTKV